MKILLIVVFLFSCLPQVNANHYYFKQIFLKEGLPSIVQTVLTDSKGFVWIGTKEGLVRFDGYELRKYTSVHDDPNSLPGNAVVNIVEDAQQQIWIVTTKGVAGYNRSKDCFEILRNRAGNEIIAYSACVVKDGVVFGVPGGVYKCDCQTQSLSFIRFSGDENFTPTIIEPYNNETWFCGDRWKGIMSVNSRTGESIAFTSDKEIMSILVDSHKRIWVAPYNKGITCYSLQGKRLTSYTKHNSALSSNTVLCMVEKDSEIWAGTDGGGINVIAPQTHEIKVIKHVPGDNLSLPVNSILCLHNDGNTLWAGTVRGGLIGTKEVFMQTYSSTLLGGSTGLSNSTILSLYEDQSAKIWIGTDGGGINVFDPVTNNFRHLVNTWEYKVSSICGFDETHLLFSCFNEGIFLLDKRSGSYQPFIIANDSINKYLFHRGKGVNVLQNTSETVLVLADVIYLYSHTKKTFHKVDLEKPEEVYGVFLPIGNDYPYTYFHDLQSIYIMDNRTNKVKRLRRFAAECDTLINSVTRDKAGTFWIGTNKGLCSYNQDKGQDKVYATNLFTNARSVVVGPNGRVWVGSNESMLFSWSVEEERFMIYSESDGLIPNEYLNGPSLLASQGDIYMGGVNGLLRIDNRLPANISENYRLDLTDVILDGEILDKESEEGLRTISIPWNSKTLTVKVMSREKDFFRKKMYRYHIEGPNERYVDSYHPEFTMHTFVPGMYSISVSCSNKNGEWTEEKQILAFRVTPPWYQSWWFILLCILIISSGIIATVYLLLRRKENRLKWLMKEHQQQVYEEKVRFLINISHELRTPLTLIYAPLKRLLQSMSDSDQYYLPLKGVYNQSQRMRNIINMVLDLRKMEVGHSNIVITPHLLNDWIRNIVKDFEMEASSRGIQIHYLLDERIGEVSFDATKCEIVIANLLSNALKYSPDHSEIRLLSELDIETQRIRISVIDQGCGLQNVDMDKLFTRFYQGREDKGGSGIGLSYARMLVELHGGIIGARENTEAAGATFFFELPLKTTVEKIECEPKPYLNELVYSGKEYDERDIRDTYSIRNYSLLLVDDDKDLVTFLKKSLQSEFKSVYTASDGVEANVIVVKEHPDIVVSDIMMPCMDGYDLCKCIKENVEISHLPVILLTALDDDRSRLCGYKNGADAYIAKPFDLELLQEQIRGVLRNRENVKKRYQSVGVIPQPEEATFSNADEQFLLKLNKIISDNLDNPKLDVVFMYNEIGMSRSSLYNKLKVLTDMGVNDYINKLRMEKAISLIASSDLTITEIAERTGFSTLRYFSTAFKQYTGKSPSTYKKELKEK